MFKTLEKSIDTQLRKFLDIDKINYFSPKQIGFAKIEAHATIYKSFKMKILKNKLYVIVVTYYM